MKYSLRSLMIAVTLACLVCGRIGYLMERAEFHRGEKRRYEVLAETDPHTHEPVLTLIVRHSRLADAYGRAVYRPWTLVDTSPQ